jgi:hypothetical protein
MRAAGRAGRGRAEVVARQRREPDLAPHGRVGQLEEVCGIGPAPQEDRLALTEGASGDLLVCRRHPPGAQTLLDEAAQEGEGAGGATGIGKRAAIVPQHVGARGPEALQRIDDEALVLLALPEIALEPRIALAGPHAPNGRRHLALGLGHAETVLRQEVGPVVEEPHVHEPRERPVPAAEAGGRRRRGEVRVQLAGGEPVREVEDPARARELGHPDAVEHHHVEPGIPPFEIDHQELALLVAAPGQGLSLDPDAGMRRLELREQGRHGIDGAQELGVLEDNGDRTGRPALIGAAREEKDDTESGGEETHSGEAGDAADPTVSPGARGDHWPP